MTIGVFVDVENMIGGLGQKFSPVPLDALIKESVQLHKLNFDDVGFLGIYAPWSESGHPGLASMREDIKLPNASVIDTPFSPGHDSVPPKSAADNRIVVDVVECALTGPFDRFVIVSGDFDMLPMVIWLREKQRHFVVGVGRAEATKFSTAKAYHRFAFYSKRDISKVASDPAGLVGNAARLRRALIDLFNEHGATTLRVELVSKRLKEIVQKEWREYAYERFLQSTLGEVRLSSVIKSLFPDGLLAWKGDYIERCDGSELLPTSGTVGPTFRGGSRAAIVTGGAEIADEVDDWNEDQMIAFTLPDMV